MQSFLISQRLREREWERLFVVVEEQPNSWLKRERERQKDILNTKSLARWAQTVTLQSYYAKLYPFFFFFFFMSIFLFWEFMASGIFFFFLVKWIFSLCWSYRIIFSVCVCVFFFLTFYMHILFVGFIETQIRCKNACINLSTLTQLKIFLSLHRISNCSA